MPSPSTSLATLRPDLSGSLMEYDLAMSRMGFIGLALFPVIEVAKQSGTFGRIPLKQLLQRRKTLRAAGGGYSRGNWTFEPDSYACREHGLEEPVDDREAQMYADFFDAELVSAERARDGVLRAHEERVIDLATDTSLLPDTGVSNAWSDLTNSTPVDDVREAKLRRWDAAGIRPNTVVISYTRSQQLKDNAQILDRIGQSGSKPASGNVTMAMIAAALDVERILVAGAQQNEANEGQDADLDSLWPDNRVLVCRVASGRDHREPCIGRTFHWGEDGSQIGGLVETYRDETVRSDIVRHRMDTDEKLMYVEAGEILTGT